MKNRIHDFISTVSAIGMLVILVISVITIAGKLAYTREPISITKETYAYTEVVVQPGDTLWSIARTQVPDQDPRDVVGAMRDLNQLESAEIFPGQVLTVMVKQTYQPLQLAGGLPD